MREPVWEWTAPWHCINHIRAWANMNSGHNGWSHDYDTGMNHSHYLHLNAAATVLPIFTQEQFSTAVLLNTCSFKSKNSIMGFWYTWNILFLLLACFLLMLITGHTRTQTTKCISSHQLQVAAEGCWQSLGNCQHQWPPDNCCLLGKNVFLAISCSGRLLAVTSRYINLHVLLVGRCGCKSFVWQIQTCLQTVANYSPSRRETLKSVTHTVNKDRLPST